MAYCRMGAVEGGMIDGVSAPQLGIDLSSVWGTPEIRAADLRTWQPGPLTTAAQDFVTIGQDTPAMIQAQGGIPSLLARPAETGESGGTPWLLLAGLGLVAYMVMK